MWVQRSSSRTAPKEILELRVKFGHHDGDYDCDISIMSIEHDADAVARAAVVLRTMTPLLWLLHSWQP